MRVVVAVLMTVFLSFGTVFSLFAADGDGQRGKGPMNGEMLKKFDKDGDGKLSDEEKTAAKAAWDKQMLEKFDKDKDGKLSDEEKEAAKNARKDEMKKKMLEKFDKDKDGKLSDEEKAEMKKFMEQHKAKGKG
ncbi:MAG: hypothetical protein A2283_00265 [Lentisphaerae bacterium RIFOXYA12_FULL_48_11]|nr:MAG: hypothetical protein A2283_00265 [Lentisphaerae bacterium RIFOXYA12_FULL_48_11]